MIILDAPGVALSWLGRQGTRAIAALVVLGIVLPSVGAILKPYVTEAVFVLLCIAFLRVDIAAVKTYPQRNMGLMLAATGGALPDLTWLYFALSQFPIYLSPQLLRSLAQRLLAHTHYPNTSPSTNNTPNAR